MLKVNVGMSRKLSRDFNSTGFSVNIEGEVCVSLEDPEAVVERIKELYDVAEESLAQQIERYESESAIARRDEQPSSPSAPQKRVETQQPAENGHEQNGRSKGRWDANTLAEELECSRRTVYRLLQTLSMAGVPWYFDESCRAYRVRPGFKFTAIEQIPRGESAAGQFPADLEPVIKKLISDGEEFIRSLRQMVDMLRQHSKHS